MLTSVYAANYNDFLTPSSLGKNIDTLNSTYSLGLTKQDGGDYSNSDTADCSLIVEVDKTKRIKRIRIIPNQGNCRFKTTSSGITFHTGKTNIVDTLNQVKLNDIQFIPGCFNCSSRIEISDILMIKRAQDNYYTAIEIEGYNEDYLSFMGNTIYGNFEQDDYYEVMDKLDKYFRTHPSDYSRNEFRLKAIETYDLKKQPWSYAIGLK